MLNAFANITKIPELRKKLLFTLFILLLFRFGIFLPIPGIDLAEVQKKFVSLATSEEGGLGTFLGIADLFVGGGLRNASIFALGIMPYITASIIFQLLTPIVPALERLSKEGEVGRKKIHQYTRYSTAALCMFQSLLIVGMLKDFQLVHEGSQLFFALTCMFTMTTGTMLLMWMGEQIDEYGIGSGASLIIMGGILARLIPTLVELGGVFKPQFGTITSDAMGIDKLVLLIGLFVLMVIGIVLITQAQRRIPVQYAKRTRGIKVYGGQKSYIPLRVNQAGVIPIIFAQSILMFPGLLKSFDNSFLKAIGESFQREGFFYILFYVGMIVFFCFFYTAIMFNPTETADRMKQYGNFIPGVRPGRKTAEFFEKVLTRVTLVGGIALAIIAIVPNFVMQFFQVNAMLAGFFGGTGLLIAVGVALDLVEKINSHLLMRQYEGFLKKGRIRGRR